MSQNMLPSSTAQKTITINGRAYTAVAGTPVVMPDQDAAIASANGWINSGGAQSVGSGTTAQRPKTGLFPGVTYHDSTLGYIVVWDGSGSWRHQTTGAVV